MSPAKVVGGAVHFVLYNGALYPHCGGGELHCWVRRVQDL